MGKTLRESSHLQKENPDFYIEMLKGTYKAFDIRDDFWSVGEFAEEEKAAHGRGMWENIF